LIVISGFGPYSHFRNNLSAEVVEKLKLPNSNFPIYRKVLPVSWDFSIILYKRLLTILDSKPKIVILLGIHSQKNYRIEKFSWNFALGFDIQNKFKIGLIQYKSPLKLKTIVNVKSLHSTLRNKVDIFLSNWAGMYICNYLYYWALKISNNQYPVIFFHIPYKGEIQSSLKDIKLTIETLIKITL
jgi:pyroglutamyl-peptidase